MKLFVTAFCLVGICFSAKAQFAIINDPDGFVNIRKEKSLTAKINGKVYDNQVLCIQDSDDNPEIWYPVTTPNYITDYSTGKISHLSNKNAIDGFVYANRLTAIVQLPHIPSKYRHLAGNKLTIKNDSVELIISSQPFNIKAHKIHRSKECPDCKTMEIDKVDEYEPVGLYSSSSSVHSIEISRFSLKIKGREVLIPQDAFKDLYNPGLETMNVYFDKKGYTYLCMPRNGDGDAGYSILWVIYKGKLLKRYMDNSLE